jgi:hypothetical protein
MHLLKSLFVAASLPSAILAFPNVPFKTSGRWFLDSTGANFTYVGVNWPGHGEAMVPEGLQYQSIQSIVTKIKSLNMNVIRLTFAIEMVDDIKDNGGDVTIQRSFQKALGTSNGDKIYQSVIKNNPQFNASTTRLQVRLLNLVDLGYLAEEHIAGLRRRRRRVVKAGHLCPSRQPHVESQVVLRRQRQKHLVRRRRVRYSEMEARAPIHG